jgi:hypothetical protein
MRTSPVYPFLPFLFILGFYVPTTSGATAGPLGNISPSEQAIIAAALAGDNPRIVATLSAADGAESEMFGASLAISGDTIVVGEPMMGPYPQNHDGSAFIFQRSHTGTASLFQVAKLTPSDDAFHFGASVAIDADTVVVGAPWSTVNGKEHQGSAYVFVKPMSGWKNMTETAKLTGASMNVQGNDYLASTVSISGDTIVLGVPGLNQPTGAAYVYVKPQLGWSNMEQTAVLFVELLPPSGTGFASSVAISGDTIVVGAFGCCIEGVIYVGQAFVYVKPASGWTGYISNFDAALNATDAGANDEFGFSAVISGGTIVVGAPQGYGSGFGAAYVFVEPTNGWNGQLNQTAKLTPSDLGGFMSQSLALSPSETTVVAGAPLGSGSVYVFVEPTGGWQNITQSAKLTAAPSSEFGTSVAMTGGLVMGGAPYANIRNAVEGAVYVFGTW